MPVWRYTRWGGWEGIRSWGRSPHEWDQRPYKRDPREPLGPSTRWGHSKKVVIYKSGRWLSPDIESDHEGTLLSDFPLPELGEINVCCLQAPQSVVFCYSSPNGLTVLKKKSRHRVPTVFTFHLSTFFSSFGEVKWLAQGHTASKRHSEVHIESPHTSTQPLHHRVNNTLKVKASKVFLCQTRRPPTQPVKCRPKVNRGSLWSAYERNG